MLASQASRERNAALSGAESLDEGVVGMQR